MLLAQDALHQFLKEGDQDIHCQDCRKRQNIVELFYGFKKEPGSYCRKSKFPIRRAYGKAY